MMNNDEGSGVALKSPCLAMPEVARRHSTGKMGAKPPVSLSRNVENVLPRYLRASTGSCHDLCKYGRKHDSEAKAKYHFRLKFSENKVAPYKEEDSAKEANSEGRKKTAPKQNYTPRTKLKPSDGVKTLGRKSPAVTGLVESVECKGSEKRTSRSSFSSTISSKLCDTSQSNVEEVDSFEELQIVDQNFLPVQKKEPSENGLDHHSEAPEKSDKIFHQPQTFQSSTNIYGSDQLDIIKPETTPIRSSRTIKESASVVRKSMPSARPKHKNESLPVSRKVLSSTKPKGDMEKSTTRKLHASSRSMTSMTSAASPRESICKIASPSPMNVSSIPSRKANVKRKVGKKGIPSEMEVKGVRPSSLSSHKPPVVRVPTVKSRSYRDTNSYSVLKNQKKIGNAKANDDAVKEKTLYVIDVREGSANSVSEQLTNNNSRSPPMPSSSSLPLAPSVNEQEEDKGHSRTDHAGDINTSVHNSPDDVQAEPLNGVGEKKILKRPGRIHAQASDVEAQKLKFRRGKIVDVESASECPKKLRFRRGGGLGEHRNFKGDTHKKRYRKKEMIDYSSNPEKAEVVMLRHQEQDKKDAQGLFNDVIEETASKLVEKRKSKVKALVGAFETVISLQEREPSCME